MDYKIVHLKDFKIVGYVINTKNGWDQFSYAWDQFTLNRMKIKNRVGFDTFGFEDYSNSFFDNGNYCFDYIAGCKVSEFEDIPDGFKCITVKESDYAVFKVNDVKDFSVTYRYIYDIWLKETNYIFNKEVGGDFEYYDSGFANGNLFIYIPVISKTN